MNWWVHSAWETSPAYLLSWIFWVLLSITLHELAHGWAALWEGDTTPRDLNRLTANPLVQMGTTSLIVFAVIGIAWGMMPVRPDRFRHGRLGEALVAAAGPAMNLLLAFVALTLMGILVALMPSLPESTPKWAQHLSTFLFVGGFLNLVLLILNLMPVPPLDGSRILGAASQQIRMLYMQPQSQMIALGLIIAVFFFGAARFIFTGSQELALWWAKQVAGVLST